VLGDAEELLDFFLVGESGGDPCGAEATCAECDAEAPPGLDDRIEQTGATAAVVAPDDGGDHNGRNVGQILGEVLRRRHVLFLRIAGAFEPVGSICHPLPGTGHVQIGQCLLQPRFADNQPAPARQISAGRSLLGHVDAVENDLVVNGSFQVEPPTDCPGCGEGVINCSNINVHTPELLF
jgi:hypothetical protein